MSKKVLFIDRDGTLVIEPPLDYQLDSLEKLEFYPKVFQYMAKIATELDYELVMVTNQDGLGTSSFPEHTFWPVQDKIINAFEKEGVVFSEVYIDKSFPHEKSITRKPETGLLTKYFSEGYDLKNSFVLGDRITDMELAKNLGAKGIYLSDNNELGMDEIEASQQEIIKYIALISKDWSQIYEFLKLKDRIKEITRNTNETKIYMKINLDGSGKNDIHTGLAFFDHMLDQIGRHGAMDLTIKVEGDIEVDEHHTIEDTMIAFGELFNRALGDKLGIERYGFCLPMDDCLAQVAVDFGGRNWLEWKADFKREKIGDIPTEMFFHLFKSFTDGAKCNLNIKAEGINEHHKIEAIFKAFAKAMKMAVKRDANKMFLPSTKGLL
jgi:imidazoleglycerol-phosphate dehydratase/histidinol-phosphatase